MSKLTLDDLDLALANLFGPRKDALEASVVGKLYGPWIAKKHVAILAVPEVLRGKAFAEELGVTDVTHDGFGGAILSYLDAVEQVPGLSNDTRAAAKRIRAAFVPQRSALVDSYAEEAAAAKKNRTKVAELEGDLKQFPTPEGKTLLDWVTGFLDAGDKLAELLDQRASAHTTMPKGSVGKLRGETLGLLNKFRAALRDEITENEALPRDLEQQVFAFIDELEERRGPAKAKTKESGG
ncbi:MAG: hypothetical protein IPM54_42350 [Polyangiaceae bacterium]|nr:hypothetical protein [Polyangiaceae bacterium]